MKPGEFVYNQVRDEAVRRGAELRIAENEATLCFQTYKRNNFKKTVAVLMEDHIKNAVKLTKQKEKSVL